MHNFPIFGFNLLFKPLAMLITSSSFKLSQTNKLLHYFEINSIYVT